jgi:hypothetical protein
MSYEPTLQCNQQLVVLIIAQHKGDMPYSPLHQGTWFSLFEDVKLLLKKKRLFQIPHPSSIGCYRALDCVTIKTENPKFCFFGFISTDH